MRPPKPIYCENIKTRELFFNCKKLNVNNNSELSYYFPRNEVGYTTHSHLRMGCRFESPIPQKGQVFYPPGPKRKLTPWIFLHIITSNSSWSFSASECYGIRTWGEIKIWPITNSVPIREDFTEQCRGHLCYLFAFGSTVFVIYESPNRNCCFFSNPPRNNV